MRLRLREILAAVPGGWPVAAAVAAWVGAMVARPLSVPVLAAVALVAVVLRRRVAGVVWICVGLALVTNVAALRALDGLDDLEAGDFDGTISLITDPEPTVAGEVRFEADSEVGHVLVEVSAGAADDVQDLLAGRRVAVTGRTEPFSRPSAWTRSRHLVGSLDVHSVEGVGPAPPPLAVANSYRDLLDRGARSLAPRHRSLLSGIVIGDDRAQPPELTADFRASGLTHLLAVSGQNLVFVLLVATPLLRRLRLWPRYLVAVTVVVGFATVTRFEPSVTRASAVAAVALLATTLGRPSDGIRHLALAVSGLLVVDPMLVHALGFRLSVAASVGVLIIAPPVISRLRGPRWFREGLGVTVGAQLAVAPVLVPAFGAMPLAALPANVLAAPLAGFTMVWGLVAGTAAGVVGGRMAAALHVPTSVGLTALEGVAQWSAALPLGRVDLRHVTVVALAAAVWHVRPRFRAVAAGALVVVVVAAVITRPPLGERRVGFDATVWVDGPVAVVVTGSRARPADVLDELHRSRVRAVGLIVSTDGDAAAVVDAVEARLPVGGVIGPSGTAGATHPNRGEKIFVSRLVVVVDDNEPHLRVRVGWR